MEKKYNEEECCTESNDCCEEIERRGQIREELDYQEKMLHILRERVFTLSKNLEPVSVQLPKNEAEGEVNKKSLVPIASRIQNHNMQLSDLIERIGEITGNLEI